MKQIETLREMRSWRAGIAGSVGLVPTMGLLHEGHLSLVRRAAAENDHTVATIFVNPAQFNDPSDLEAYPDDRETDARLLADAGCDLLYAPRREEIYPESFQTWIEVGEIGSPLEGAARPGHFRGVATVVLKLVHQTRADRAYFGEKDFQQLAVVSTMARDLDVPVEIVPCPTVREPDGLAMSSRNRRLSEGERAAAVAINRALRAGERAYREGERDPSRIKAAVERSLGGEPRLAVEYISAADPRSLTELDATPAHELLLSLAAAVGNVRLIDNVVLAERAERGS